MGPPIRLQMVSGASLIKDRTMSELPENPVKRRRDDLPPAAQRALAEAEQRRQAAAAETRPREIGGRAGPDPSRYGDWEVKGIVSDF